MGIHFENRKYTVKCSKLRFKDGSVVKSLPECKGLIPNIPKVAHSVSL